MKYASDDHEFAILILHHREKLSDEEVCEWMKDPEHVKLLEQMACFRMEAEVSDNEDIKAIRKGLRREMYGKRPVKWIMAVAASVMLALGVWQMWQNMEAGVLQQTVVCNEILPGEKKAQLIMADGEVIDLHARTQKIKDIQNGVVRNDSVDGLKYQSEKVGGNGVIEEYNTLRIPVGGFYKLELSDGTKVWLNAASELKFPVQFIEDKREVYLSGEGYFEVAKDSPRRFTVHLKNSSVTVLGTKFNINTYEDESLVSTTLAEGSVAFYSSLNNQKVLLKPGMQSEMDMITGKISVKEVDPEVYIAWVDGRFIFPAMKLDAIMRQLQRWYNFELFYQDQKVRQYEFRGSVSRDMGIRQILDIIEETTDLKFDIKGKTVIVKKVNY